MSEDSLSDLLIELAEIGNVLLSGMERGHPRGCTKQAMLLVIDDINIVRSFGKASTEKSK